MKVEQALIGSKVGPFADTRVAGSGSSGLAGGVEKEGVDGVVVRVSSQSSTSAGRLRVPEPTAEGIFGVLARPQVYAPTGGFQVTQAQGSASSLRTSGLVASTQPAEREGRGLVNTGNNPERLSPTSLFVRQDETQRAAGPVRGETSLDTIASGLDLNTSFLERPAQALLNEQAGAPFGGQGGLPRQLGPNPITGDGFGILPTSAADAGTFKEQSLKPGAAAPGGLTANLNIITTPPEGGGLVDPPQPEAPEVSTLGSFAPNAVVSEIGIPGNEEQDQEAPNIAQLENLQESARGPGQELELTQAQEEVVRQLQNRDREVREHEQAHVAAAGGLAGSPSYSYTSGPDNRQYAVGGEVSIDVSEGGSPEETVAKAQTIQRAALAPAEPSGQDRAVAAAAARMELNALGEMRDQAIAEFQVQQEAIESGGPTPQDSLAEENGGQAQAVFIAPSNGAAMTSENRNSFEPVTGDIGAQAFNGTGGSLPQDQAGSSAAAEALRPNMTTEVFQELRVAQESIESREVLAGAVTRGASDYQRSENAFQGREDYISVA